MGWAAGKGEESGQGRAARIDKGDQPIHQNPSDAAAPMRRIDAQGTDDEDPTPIHAEDTADDAPCLFGDEAGRGIARIARERQLGIAAELARSWRAGC